VTASRAPTAIGTPTHNASAQRPTIVVPGDTQAKTEGQICRAAHALAPQSLLFTFESRLTPTKFSSECRQSRRWRCSQSVGMGVAKKFSMGGFRVKFQTKAKILKEGETMKTLNGVDRTGRVLGILGVLTALGLLQPTTLLARTQASGIINGKTEQGYPFMSGGVGIEERNLMLRDAHDYDLDLSFADNKGHYLSDVNVVITNDQGKQLVNTTSAGPWFYIELPDGKYDVKASFDNRTEEIKDLNLSKGHPLTRLLDWHAADEQTAKIEER
jgi:hypothetical protein